MNGYLLSRPMAQIREIKRRIKAVGNIRRITNTMQMIATARFKAAQDRATATKPYTEKVRGLVQELAANAGDVENPLFHPPSEPANRELVLVLSSQRGLCGSFNSNVLRKAMHYITSLGEKACVEAVGKKGIAFFKFAGVELAVQHNEFGDKPKYEDVEAVATRYIEEFIAWKYDKISVAYMKFHSAGRQTAVIEQLLPMEPPSADGNGDGSTVQHSGFNVEYEFSPDAETLLSDLLPITVKTELYQTFTDSTVSEQVARMVAMKAATDNAGKLGKTLKRNFNRARQTQITTELTEIVGGAAALE